jgi:hypothetical protein
VLSFGAVRTEVVRAADLHGTDYRKEGFGAHFLEAGRMTAQAGDFKVIDIRMFELQQLR